MASVMSKRGYAVEVPIYTRRVWTFAPGLRDVDWIITNPPFSAAEEFIRHARELEPAGFAFLLKTVF
jgi:methylase of polypeptide subunit release factors